MEYSRLQTEPPASTCQHVCSVDQLMQYIQRSVILVGAADPVYLPVSFSPTATTDTTHSRGIPTPLGCWHKLISNVCQDNKMHLVITQSRTKYNIPYNIHHIVWKIVLCVVYSIVLSRVK